MSTNTLLDRLCRSPMMESSNKTSYLCDVIATFESVVEVGVRMGEKMVQAGCHERSLVDGEGHEYSIPSYNSILVRAPPERVRGDGWRARGREGGGERESARERERERESERERARETGWTHTPPNVLEPMHQFRLITCNLRIVMFRVGTCMLSPASSVMLSLLIEMPSSPTDM